MIEEASKHMEWSHSSVLIQILRVTKANAVIKLDLGFMLL